MATWSPARPSHELVRLAGAKSARAVQHLNCPSYTSSQKDREGATIADPSNSCLKLVSFLFDDFNRREHRHGLGKYSTRRSRLHLDLSNEYRQNINAKVEIVWGKRQKSSSSTNLETVYKLCPYGVPTFMMSPSMLSISMQMMYAQSADRVRTLLSVCSGSSYLCIIRSTSMMIGECPSR